MYTYLLLDVFSWVTPVTILDWKNRRGTAGPRKKVGSNIIVSPAWWCSVVMKIDLIWLTLSTQHMLVIIVRTVVRKSSNRLKFCWLKAICCICQSNELEREIQHKTGKSSRGAANNLGRPWPTQPRLEPPLVTPGQSTTNCL